MTILDTESGRGQCYGGRFEQQSAMVIEKAWHGKERKGKNRPRRSSLLQAARSRPDSSLGIMARSTMRSWACKSEPFSETRVAEVIAAGCEKGHCRRSALRNPRPSLNTLWPINVCASTRKRERESVCGNQTTMPSPGLEERFTQMPWSLQSVDYTYSALVDGGE